MESPSTERTRGVHRYSNHPGLLGAIPSARRRRVADAAGARATHAAPASNARGDGRGTGLVAIALGTFSLVGVASLLFGAITALIVAAVSLAVLLACVQIAHARATKEGQLLEHGDIVYWDSGTGDVLYCHGNVKAEPATVERARLGVWDAAGKCVLPLRTSPEEWKASARVLDSAMVNAVSREIDSLRSSIPDRGERLAHAIRNVEARESRLLLWAEVCAGRAAAYASTDVKA